MAGKRNQLLTRQWRRGVTEPLSDADCEASTTAAWTADSCSLSKVAT